MAKRDPKSFRLRFQGTHARKYASTMKAAVADARYWLAYGQMKVCIDRKMPSGTYSPVRCLRRRRRR